MTHVDPVCGMTVDEQDAAGSCQYEGVTYFFCHPGCLDRFQRDPRGFVHPNTSTAIAPDGEYTCPMHPEIGTSAPGACPVCGMALEPRNIELEERPNPELTDMTRRFWVAALV